MSRGGARPGAGRPKGSKAARSLEIAERAFETGLSPLEVMLDVMRKSIDEGDTARALEAAKAAAPYLHPRLAAIELTGAEGGPIQTEEISAERRARAVMLLLARAGRPRIPVKLVRAGAVAEEGAKAQPPRKKRWKRLALLEVINRHRVTETFSPACEHRCARHDGKTVRNVAKGSSAKMGN